MTECQNSLGEFTGWSRTATDHLVHELGGIILKCGLHSNGAAIARKDWDELVTGNLRIALGDAEGYSMRMAFVRASKWARAATGQDKIEFVFDQRREREQEGRRIFELFERHSRIDHNIPVPVSITFCDSYRCLPLQAADLLAWEQYHYAREYLNSSGVTRVASRIQLQRLSRGGRITIGIAPRSAIEKMIALEIGNEEEIARAAELMTGDATDFARRFDEPL